MQGMRKKFFSTFFAPSAVILERCRKFSCIFTWQNFCRNHWTLQRKYFLYVRLFNSNSQKLHRSFHLVVSSTEEWSNSHNKEELLSTFFHTFLELILLCKNLFSTFFHSFLWIKKVSRKTLHFTVVSGIVQEISSTFTQQWFPKLCSTESNPYHSIVNLGSLQESCAGNLSVVKCQKFLRQMCLYSNLLTIS